jgi:hypothetical protein
MRYDHPPEERRSRKPGSIAIWNRAKIIFAIAMGMWMIDISLFISGKYVLQITGEYLLYLVIIGLIRVNFNFDCSKDLFVLPDNRSSALSGRLRQTPASWSTLIALNLPLSSPSFPTLGYFSSCSLACSACASEETVPLLWEASSGNRFGGGSSRCRDTH